MTDKLTYSTAEAAEVVGCSDDKIRHLVRSGVLPKVPHMGRLILIPRAKLHEVLDLPDPADVPDGSTSIKDGPGFS